MNDFEVVNIVGSGKFGRELDLMHLSNTLGDIAEYEPEIYPGMYLRVRGNNGPLMTVYATGKFIVIGANTHRQLNKIKDNNTTIISDAIEQSLDIEWFKPQNFVCKGDIGRELDLDAIAVDLGLTHTEYEPEQFPGIIYRSDSFNGVGIIFRSGKLIVTGPDSKADAEAIYNKLVGEIEELFD